MSPRFSIVIPTYNRAASITNTLTSCFEQTFTDFEIIVVDDGSTDNTAEVLANIDDVRLVAVNQANAGPAAARNTGMDIAKGEYIAFLDSDDLWYPAFLDTMQKKLETAESVVLYGHIIVDRGVGRYWIKPDRALGSDESIYDYLYVSGGFIQTSTMVIPAQLAKDVRWDESVTYGDNDQFAIDCWRTGTPFQMIDEPLTLYADVISSDALSQLPIYAGNSDKHTNFFRWMATQRPHMSNKAWLAYKARFESVGLARHKPLASFSHLYRAWRAGAMSTKGVARQSLQNYAPRFYRTLTDQYVRWRGLRLNVLDR
ncbi:MAG: glycosyltransferase family 2 protein [Granulosicoccus sp.]